MNHFDIDEIVKLTPLPFYDLNLIQSNPKILSL